MNKLQDFSKHLAKNVGNDEPLHWRGQKLTGLGAWETDATSRKNANERSNWMDRVTRVISRDGR